MSVYIYSTLANHQHYTTYHPTPKGQIPVKKHVVMIKGQARLPKVVGTELITPMGIRTEISDEDYEILKTIPLFQTHLKNGYITIDSKRVNPDKKAKDLERDPSSPKVESDFPNADEPQPANVKGLAKKK